MSTLITRIDAVAALLWSPFVAAVCVLIACAVVWVARYDRRNPFAVRPDVQAERKDLHKRAWGDEVMDERQSGESFCATCPDHEACMTGWPCSLVKRLAIGGAA